MHFPSSIRADRQALESNLGSASPVHLDPDGALLTPWVVALSRWWLRGWWHCSAGDTVGGGTAPLVAPWVVALRRCLQRGCWHCAAGGTDDEVLPRATTQRTYGCVCIWG